ncbi:MAG: glycerate kinase [Muribaculaceae bacterium]|nr:glycerate kinase [Muribaculaceae bacterium]
MIKKVVIAIDSFKGSVSSLEAGNQAAKAIRDVVPDCDVTVLEVADGGEGTARALVNATNGKMVAVDTVNPLGEPIKAEIGLSRDCKTAYIDTASAAGITLIPRDKLNPMKTSTYGVGKLIKHAISIGCNKIIIGAGGSATVDGGIGLLQALGYRFLDHDCQNIAPNEGSLNSIRSIDASNAIDLSNIEIIVASDVDNLLCGDKGAAHVFGPQKGATPQMVDQLDAGLLNLSKVADQAGFKGMAEVRGGGAAGGLSAALAVFANAKIQSGIETILDIVNFDAIASNADLVITGEGKIDNQTLGGKAPYGIAMRAHKAGVPRVTAICGTIDPTFNLTASPFTAVFPIISGPCSLSDALQPATTHQNIYRTVSSIISLI